MNRTRARFVPDGAIRFRATPIHHFELDRRDFFKLLARIAVFAIAEEFFRDARKRLRGATVFPRRKSCPKRSPPGCSRRRPARLQDSLGKVEIGQNIRTPWRKLSPMSCASLSKACVW